MLFNSLEFLFIFLPVTFVIYFALNKMKLIKLALGWLVAASLFFMLLEYKISGFDSLFHDI